MVHLQKLIKEQELMQRMLQNGGVEDSRMEIQHWEMTKRNNNIKLGKKHEDWTWYLSKNIQRQIQSSPILFIWGFGNLTKCLFLVITSFHLFSLHYEESVRKSCPQNEGRIKISSLNWYLYNVQKMPRIVTWEIKKCIGHLYFLL